MTAQPSGGTPKVSKISETVIRIAGNSQDGIQAIGGFLARYPDLEVVAVPNERATGSPERYSFAMSMGVRPADAALADRIDAVLARHAAEFKSLLERNGVSLYTPRNPEFP